MSISELTHKSPHDPSDQAPSDTSQEPPIWLFFGLAGSGKSHVGEVIGRTLGWPLYHADDDITPAMRHALAEAKPFTDAMRDEYFEQLVQRITRFREPARPLLVTQGVYKQRHRDWLSEQLPSLIPVWVFAPPELIQQRLSERRDGVQLTSAAALVQDFEAPSVTTVRINNDGDDAHILAQFDVCRRAMKR